MFNLVEKNYLHKTWRSYYILAILILITWHSLLSMYQYLVEYWSYELNLNDHKAGDLNFEIRAIF